MKNLFAAVICSFAFAGAAQAAAIPLAPAAHAVERALLPLEVHQRLVLAPEDGKAVALTLDACGGAYDAELIDFLIASRIPATLFVTRKWLDRNAEAVAVLRAHADLFDIEDHGANHVPAVIGLGRKVYGIAGEADLAHLQSEVREGAAAINAATGAVPHWYRAATAVYDQAALKAIAEMGYKVAGFSVNADAGATLKRDAIIARVTKAQPGDIIIAHMNKPAGDTAEGLSVALRSLQQAGYRFVTLSKMNVRQING